MIRSTTILSLAAGVLCALMATPHAQAAFYYEVFSEAEAAGSQPAPFLDTVAVKDGKAYAISREGGSGAGGSVVVYDGSTFTEIMDSADWPASFDIAGANGASIVNRGSGDQLRFVNFFTNSIWEVDTVTGTPVEVVPDTTFDAFVGANANLALASEVLSDGTAFVYDGVTDNVLQVTPGGFLINVISSAELTALAGSDILNATGFELVGPNLYFGSNASDKVHAWNLFTDTGSDVFDAATIEALTNPGDNDGSLNVGDFFFAPDGLIYFYEGDADYIMSFDPADPAGTLAVVLSEAELNAGPGSDLVGQFEWWEGGLAWTDQSDGFYAIPEPATALLGVIALFGLGARRRS